MVYVDLNIYNEYIISINGSYVRKRCGFDSYILVGKLYVNRSKINVYKSIKLLFDKIFLRAEIVFYNFYFICIYINKVFFKRLAVVSTKKIVQIIMYYW